MTSAPYADGRERAREHVSRVAHGYDEWAPWYHGVHGAVAHGVEHYIEVFDTVLTGAGVAPGGRILDAGCGIGLGALALVSLGYEVTGLDISTASLARARRLVEGGRGRCVFIEGDVTDFPDGLADFDAVAAMSSVLDHLPDETAQKQALESMAGALKPGGWLAIGNNDHARLLATEPDDVCHPPVASVDDAGPFLYVERRLWSGTPRERRYEKRYYRVGDNGDTRILSLNGLAMTLQEISEKLALLGLTDIAWKNPEETGYYQPIVLARRPLPGEAVENRRESATGPTVVLPGVNIPLRPSESESTYLEDVENNPFEEAPDFKLSTLGVAVGPDGKQRVMRRRQTTLVMLSGGIDSVYVLTRLLRESDDEIIAHHIHLVNMEKRHKAEAIACRRIVDHLRSVERSFFYTESLIDRNRFKAFGYDDLVVAFEAGLISLSFMSDRGYGIDRWTAGTCMEEEIEEWNEAVELQEHMLNVVSASSWPQPSPRFFQLKIVPKREEMDYMGPELVDLCWTCRRPVWSGDGAPSECHVCSTCELMAKVRAGEDTIPRRGDAGRRT